MSEVEPQVHERWVSRRGWKPFTVTVTAKLITASGSMEISVRNNRSGTRAVYKLSDFTKTFRRERQ